MGSAIPGGKAILAVALSYAILGRISLFTRYLPVGPTPVWIPSGFALAAALRFGPRVAIGVAIGVVLYSLSIGFSIPSMLAVLVPDALEPVLGSYLMRRFFGFDGNFNRTRDVGGLLFGGGVASCWVASAAAISGLSFVHTLEWGDFVKNWIDWWIPSALSDLIVTPLLLVWSGARPMKPRLGLIRYLELVFVTLMGVSVAVYVFFLIPSKGGEVFAYWLYPFVIWLALRMGLRATVTGIFLIGVVAVWGAALGGGPFVGLFNGKAPHEILISTQVFLAVTSLAGLVLATGIAEKEKALFDRSQLIAQLQAALQMREEFLSVASHELKTPLTSLSMQIQIINQLLERGKITGVSKKDVDEVIRVSKLQLARFSSLLSELLDVSRIEAGRMILHIEEYDLVRQVMEIVDRFRLEFESQGTRVELKGDSELKGRWDPDRMEQVIVNLLTNAMKFGRGKPIEIILQKRGDLAIFTIKDRGIGIAKIDQQRIFDRFERAVSSRKFGGMGLGLYVSRKNVEAHQGAIRVESEPGEGAAFIIELPINLEESRKNWVI